MPAFYLGPAALISGLDGPWHQLVAAARMRALHHSYILWEGRHGTPSCHSQYFSLSEVWLFSGISCIENCGIFYFLEVLGALLCRFDQFHLDGLQSLVFKVLRTVHVGLSLSASSCLQNWQQL